MSVFDIHRDLRISPIVLLSACDTSPVDRGHDSVAEAFFLAGARTVLSSALPILSIQASTFLARLVL
ncbi:CHAT domain-containing protein, partial [Streptomyces sp. S12]|nr:CHAT domain-containing protein [Streptomyces sp. S12]